MIKLRRATYLDYDLLFRWRNDPTAYANFRHAKPVSKGDHMIFMQVYTRNPDYQLWIAEKSENPFGYVRFRARPSGLREVSIGLDKDYRGQGLGYLALRMATKDETSLVAEIKRSNVASRRIFERCYFEEEGGDEDFVLYRRESN